MISFRFPSSFRRTGTTLTGVLAVALSSLLLLCGAGTVPIQNLLPQGALQGDLDAGGHNLTNAASITATNVVASSTATLPAGVTLLASPSQYTGTNGELVFSNTRTVNTLSLRNTHNAGTSALTFRDLNNIEIGAIGYGNPATGIFGGRYFLETSTTGTTPKDIAFIITNAGGSIASYILNGSTGTSSHYSIHGDNRAGFFESDQATSKGTLGLHDKDASGAGAINFYAANGTTLKMVLGTANAGYATTALQNKIFLDQQGNDFSFTNTGTITDVVKANGQMTIAPTAPGPGLTIATSQGDTDATTKNLRLQNTNTAGLVDLQFLDSSGAERLNLFYANTSNANSHFAGNSALSFAGDLKFHNNVAFTYPVTLKGGTGDLLIGTETDDGSSKLQVNGAAKATNVSVTSAAANTLAGFDSSRNLKSLTIGTGLSFDGTTLSNTGDSTAYVAGSGLTQSGTGTVTFAVDNSLYPRLSSSNTFTARQTAQLTTEQWRLGYDGSNYDSFTVGSSGSLNIAATGTNPNITLTPGGSGQVVIGGGQLSGSSFINLNVGTVNKIGIGGSQNFSYQALVPGTTASFDLGSSSLVWRALYVGTVNCETAGSGLAVKEGSNCKQGTATLSSGTVTVSNTSVTANSRILLMAQDNNSTGALRVSARTAGTSFTITSSNPGDSGVVAYEIFEPAP